MTTELVSLPDREPGRTLGVLVYSTSQAETTDFNVKNTHKATGARRRELYHTKHTDRTDQEYTSALIYLDRKTCPRRPKGSCLQTCTRQRCGLVENKIPVESFIF